MANRAKNAQYAYGITIEAGNYNEVINGFEKRLKDLDKSAKTTTATFKALSDAMKSGKQVDFGKAESQITGLVADMEEVSRWRDQLAGGQKLSDMFDGLDQVKQSLGQVTGQLDKFGNNIEEIFSILQNVPQNTSKTFVDIRKVLQRQASDMSKIIAELNNPTEKTDISALKKQLSSLASDFANEWNRATSQGIRMDQVVDFKPFANTIKSVISGARSLGAEFNDVSNSVLETTKNVAALYNVKHPTGMFKDIVSVMTSIETKSKKAEQAASKVGASFKAAISIVDKLNKSDMGLAKKSREMDEFLAKLKNPEITIDLKNKDDKAIEDEFKRLEQVFDDIVGDNDITPDFLKNLPVDKLKELGTTLQNIVAIGRKFPKLLDIGNDVPMNEIIGLYSSDLKKVVAEIKEELDEVNALISESGKTLKSQLEALGLKDIELQVKLADLTGDKVNEYVKQLNVFVDTLTGQLANKGAIELPINIQIPGITPDNVESKNAKDIIKSAIDEYSKVAADVSSSENTIKDARNKTVSKIISGAFGSNDNLDLYLNYIKEQFSKIRETVKRQKKEIQDMLSLDFSWNKENAANSFSNLFVDLQDYFSDPENAIKVEIDNKYLVDRIKDAFKEAGGVDLKLSSSGTPIDQSELATAIISAFTGSLPATRKDTPSATRQNTYSSSPSLVTEKDIKSKFVFNIKEFMSKYSGELSEGLNETLLSIVDSVRHIAKTANGERVNQEVRAKIQAAFGSLDLSKVAQMTNDEIISWVQNALLKADESGRAVGADLQDALKRTKVSWKSISNFSNALNQLFIKIDNETRDVDQAAKDRQKVAVLKDFGYRARAIDSKSAVVRKLGKGELDTEFLKSQMARLKSVEAYKNSLGEKGSGIVKWLDKAIGIYQKLINISNGTTTFNTEAEKQEEITKLREELSKIRVSDDKQLIETLAGNITVSKRYKNGTKSRGQTKGFNGGSRGLEKALSLIENAGDDGVITITFTSGPTDKAFREWIESENEYGETVNTRRRSRDNNVRGESRSSLTSPSGKRERLLDQEINFKPFSQSRKPIDWDEYESSLQRRLQENEDALNEQKNIVDEAKNNLTSANRKKSSADKKVLSYTDDRWIDVGKNILKMVSEDEKSGLNDKSIKQLSKLVKSSYNKDSKNFKKVYAQAEKDLNTLMSEEASEDNIAKIKSLLDFIQNLNKAAENYSSAAKYVDENFVISEEIDKSLFESASKRVSDAGEIKVKAKKYSGAELPSSDVGKYVTAIKRKENIERFAGYSSDYQEHIKSLLDNALDSLNKAAQDKDTPANRKKIQGILQYIDDLKAQFDQFKEIERKIYETYDFEKSKPDVKFEDLSSKDNIVETYKKAKETLQERIEEIDRELADINKQKGGIKHYTEEQKNLAKLQFDASQYYSKVSNIRQLENSIKNAKTEDQRNSLTQLLQKESNKEVISPLKQVENISSFIDELSKKLSSDKLSTEEKGVLSSVLKEAKSLLGELKSVRNGGQTPMFTMSKSRYEDIIADNSAEAERIAEAEKKALARRAKVVEELGNLEKSSLGAEALRRASSVKQGESYRSEAIYADIDKSSAQSALRESEERLRLLEKEREALQLEKEKLSEKKKYNNLLIQEKRLKEEIDTLENKGVSSEEKKAELTKLQARISKQEKKLGINFEEVSPSMTKEKAFSMASEYDAQEKLLRSQIKALESKLESTQELIDSLTARGFNSAKGESELRRFTNDRVEDFKSSDYFRVKKNEIRDKYIKGVYKEDGTLDDSDSLEGKTKELFDKYVTNIRDVLFNLTDAKEDDIKRFCDNFLKNPAKFTDEEEYKKLSGIQKQLFDTFKDSNFGNRFMDEYKEIKSFYWGLIREEEDNLVDDYKKSIKVDKHNGTASYTSYNGDTIQEVIVDLKSQIIQRLRGQIESEIKPILSEKTNLLGRVSESKMQALGFAGLKESDIRNADVDDKISSIESEIRDLQNTNLTVINRRIEDIKKRDSERINPIEENKDSIITEIEEYTKKVEKNREQLEEADKKLNEEKNKYLKEIRKRKGGLESQEANIALERFKINATNEYLNSDTYLSEVESIKNKYYGKNDSGKSLFEEKTSNIVDKYRDSIYRILSNSSKYTEEEIDSFLNLLQNNPELYSSSEAYFKLGKTKNADMAKFLSDNSERVWSNLVRDYKVVRDNIEDSIQDETELLVKKYKDSFVVDRGNNTISYTSYSNGKVENVVNNLRKTLISAIEQEVIDILSGKDIEGILGDSVGSYARGVVSTKQNGKFLQKTLNGLIAEKQKIESRIASGTFSEDDQKDIDKLLIEKEAIEDKIASLEKEIEAWEFVKKAREEARELDRKTVQEKEATELSKIERYEQSIAEKKEKQRNLQEELNILRGAEEKDIDAIDRKEGELEEVSKKIVELEQKKQRSENNLSRIHERMENAKMSTTSSSGGGILSPIINLLSEIRDMLSKISGVPSKNSEGGKSGSSTASNGKLTSETKSMLSKYWQKKNGKSATKEEWEQLKKDYVDGKLTDLDEVLAQDVQAKIEKEKKEDSKPVTKNTDTKKSNDRFSNILRLAGFRDENNKAIQLASKSTDEFLSDAQALYDEVKNWSGDKTSDEYLAKQLRLGKTLTALRSSLPRTYSGKNGYTKAEEWANYLSENGLSGAMESSIKNQKNLKAVIENGVAVVTEEVVEQGVEEGKKVAEEPQQKSTSKKQKYAGGLTWSKTKDAIKNGANKPEDGLSLEEYITKAQSLYNEINSWVGEKNIEYFSKRLELGSVMQKAAVAVKQANPDKKFKNTDLYNYFAKQYDMENVNSLALTSKKLDGNKEIMAALADAKPVDTTPVTQAVENTDNAIIEHVTETARVVGEEVNSKDSATEKQTKQKNILSQEPFKVYGAYDAIIAKAIMGAYPELTRPILRDRDIIDPLNQLHLAVDKDITQEIYDNPVKLQEFIKPYVEQYLGEFLSKSKGTSVQDIVSKSGISDERMSELADMALKKKSDLISKEIEGRQSKSKPLNTSDKQKDLEYVFDKGAKSSQEFTEAIFKMVDAIEAGKNVANVEYGFTERNGKRIELATGDIDSVYYDKLSGVIDSMTHSHAYKKGTNNMMFSLADMKQMRNLAEENELSKYSLIYGKEMMSMNLGKDSLKTAMAVAQKYPIINDVVTAMFATADGESVAAENSGEMARILNGYLQRVISEAGGELSVTNSSGLDVSSKYSITDDEYTKLNNVVSNFKNYFDNNYGKVTNLGEYTKVIKEYLSKEFGKNFIDGIVNKEYDKSKGGIGTEYSAEKKDDLQNLISLFSRSKRLTESEQAVYDRLVSMPIDELIAEKQKIDAAINANKEPEIKPTLTRAQMAALNPDDVTALQKASIKQFSKVRNWNENNVGNIEGFLGADNKTLVAYKTQFEELAKIALDLKAKGESGTIITKEDISQLDSAITKTKELQTALTKEAQYKQLKDAGLIVNGKTKIKHTDTYSDRQAIMTEYAKKYAARNKSEYQFGQYDFINDKISFNMIDSAGKVTKAVMGWSDAFNTAYIQSSKLQGSLDKITQEIYKTDEAIKAGEDYGFFKEQSDGVKEYNDALKEYEAQVRAVAKSSQKDLDKNFEALHAAQVKVINAGKNLLDKQKDAYGFNNAQKVLGREGNVDAVLQNYRDQGINVNDIELVKNYNDAITALNDKVKTLKENGKLWDSDEQSGLKLLADRAIEAEKALLKADEAQRQLNGTVIEGKDAKFFEGINPDNVNQVKHAMEQYAMSINGVDAQSIKWSEDQRALSYSVRTGKHEVSDFTIGVKELTNEFYVARTGTRTLQTGMEKFLTSIKGKFQEVARYIISFGSFYRIWAEIQKGVTYVREIDSALTELKKVTDETDETYAKFLKTMSHMADVVGSTTSNLTKSAADWARLGYSIQEAGELAKNTSILMNVSEFENVDNATDTLISALQAFKKEGADVGSFSMEIIDKFNEVGNNYAISTSDLADSLTRSSAALVAAGSTLEESIALTTAANTIIQDPESVGNALKVVSMRIRGVKTELEDAGEETDGLVTNTSKLNDQIMALTASANGGKGIKIIDDSGAFRSPYEILLDIAKIWDKMDSMSQAGLLEKIAGKTRGSVVAALLQSPDILEKSFESATNAAGSATNELNTYLDSIEGRISLFTNSLQVMWQNLIKTKYVKFIVDLGTSLVKLADSLGLVGVAAIALGGKLVIPKIFSGIKSSITAVKEAYNSARGIVSTISSFSGSGLMNFLGGKVEVAKITEITHALGAEITAQGTLNKELAKSILLKNGVQAEDVEGALAAMGFTTANNGLAFSFKKVGASILEAAKAFWASPFGKFAIISGVIIGVIALMNGLIDTHKDYVKKLKETSDEISDVKSNIESLEDELKSVGERINELNSKDKLSFTEKEELKNLKAQNAELERSIRIEEQKEKRLQKKAAKNLNDAVKSDISLNGTTTVYKNQNGEYVSVSEAKDVSSSEYAANGDAAIKTGYSKETVSIIQSKIIEYQRIQKELEKAKEKLENLGDDASEKEVKDAEAAVDRLQRSADISYGAISDTIDKINEDYLSQEGVEWQYGNPDKLEDWQKQMNANLKIIYDAQDKLAIGADNTGKAIKSAFSRVTLQTEFQDELKEIQETSEITGEKLKEMYDTSKDTSDTGLRAFIQSLLDCGVIANTTSDELQKVVDLSIELGDNTSDAAVANKKLAKSQKMLQYNKLYKDLKKVIDQMKKEIALRGKVTERTKSQAAAIREQMRALEAEIDKYDILSDRMAEAKNNLDKLSEIQSADEDKNYITNLGNAAEIIQNAFNTGELASDSFVAAAEILLKPNFEMEDETAMMNDIRSQWENIQKYFTIEIGDDGSIEKFDMTYSNVMSVLDDAAEKGLIKWDEWHKEYTILEEDANKWNDALGVTDEFLYAFGNKIDNMNIQRLNGEAGNFIDQLNTGLEDSLYRAEKSIAELTDKYAAGELSFEEYISKLSEEESKRKEFEQRVVDSTTGYVTAQNEVDKLTSKLNELKDAYSAETDENKKLAILEDIKKVGTELGIASDKLKEFENELGGEPGDFAIQVMLDANSLQSQIEAAFNEFKNNNENLPTEINVENPSALVDALDLDPATGKFSIPAELDLDENARNDLQSIVDLINLTNKSALKVGLDPVYTKSAIDGLQGMTAEANNTTEAVENIPDSVKIDTSSAVKSLNAAKGAANSVTAAVNAIPSSKTITITTVYETVGSPSGGSPTGVSPTGGSPTGGNSTKHKDKISQLKKEKKKKGINVADGTAHASGNWGLPQAEHNSLVGELGPETVVDTHTGRYYTVGDHGAELVDLPKDAIIFNHLQTEQLFKNGHINSRGKSYANGNAYAGGTFYGDYLSKYQSGSSGYGSLDKAEEAEEQFEEVFDWFEILLEEINAQLDLMNAKLENAVGIKDKEGILSQLLSGNHYKLEELSEGLKLYTDYANKLLAKIPNQYKKMSEDGAVYITEFYGDANEEVVEAINNYREWAEKVQDLNQQLEETRKEISSLRVQTMDMINTEYENEIGLITNINDRIQDTMDFLEESGKRVSGTFYDEMIKNSTKQLDKLKEQRIKMQDELDEAVKSGDVKKFSEDWYEMVNAIYDVDASIIECETDIEEFQNAILDLHWDNFEKIIDAIDAISDEAEQLRDLIDDDDIADDVGNWTRDGIAALGLAAEEMEKAKYRAELYGKEIEQLNKDYAAGKYSTDEYNEKLKDLKDSQWDSIDAYESAKKAIIDLNKTRIEAVKDGIQKEIDAYEKLISKRKEDLSAQKDAHDFNKTVQDQQKEIDKIQRQIDAMEGDTSAAAIAKRKKLQEELYNAQQELAETYYDHDIETQQNALDKELEAYRQEKEDRMEELDNYLKNEEQVLADSLQLILGNADGISAFLKDIEENYGVSIYSSVVAPWNDGADALAKYLEMLKAIKGEQEDLQLEADKTASALLDTINKSTSSTTSAEYVEPPKPEPTPTPTPTPTKPKWFDILMQMLRKKRSGGGSSRSSSSSSVGVGTTVTVKNSATNFAKDGGNGTKMQSWVPGSSFTVMETSGDKVLIGIPGASGGQYTGWVDKKDLVGYAKGTTGVKKSQLARIDEGDLEELVLHADGNGRLAFLSKGTSVIPADITENLMKLGSIDPTEMLKRSTPSIGAPHIINNNMELNMEFGSLVHVDNCTQDAIPELQKMVRSEFDNMMKQVNNGLKRYAR